MMTPPRKKQKQTAAKVRGKDGKFVKVAVWIFAFCRFFVNQRQEQTQTPQQEQLVDTTPKGPASERLLAQVEMMEQILLDLPMRDLLFATRVCKKFLNVIEGSLKLKRALFLEPVACGSVSYLDWRYDDKDMYPVSLNLGEHIRGPKRDQRPSIYPRHWGKNRDDTGEYRIVVNPLLAKIFPVLQKNGCYFNETVGDMPAAMKHRGASWTRMYFTQPPINSMILEWDSGPDPAIYSDDDNEDNEQEDDDEEEEGDEGANPTNPNPAATAPNPPAPTQAGPFLPGVPPVANAGGAAGNAGTGGGGDADWTVTCFSKWMGTKGLVMGELVLKLQAIECPTWIDGIEQWEEYCSAEELEKMVVKK